MQQKLVFPAVVFLATLFAKSASAEDCPSPLPVEPTAAQMITCVSEMQKEIAQLKKDVTNRPSSGKPEQLEFKSPAPFPRGWSTHGGAYVQNFEYAIDSGGIVHLRGLMTGCPNGQPIFNLPEGYRPAIRVVLGTIGGNGAFNARVDILPSGNVIYHWAERCDIAGDPWLTLDGLSFKAEQ